MQERTCWPLQEQPYGRGTPTHQSCTEPDHTAADFAIAVIAKAAAARESCPEDLAEGCFTARDLAVRDQPGLLQPQLAISTMLSCINVPTDACGEAIYKLLHALLQVRPGPEELAHVYFPFPPKHTFFSHSNGQRCYFLIRLACWWR